MMHYARVVECWEHAVPLCACVDDCKDTQEVFRAWATLTSTQESKYKLLFKFNW